MKVFALVSLFVVSCAASAVQYTYSDPWGGYTFGYNGLLSSRQETKDAHGITHGGYSYVDANGILQSVRYTADAIHGFRVAATNLPQGPSPAVAAHWALPAPAALAPLDTPEVAAAKAAHFAAHAEARSRGKRQVPVDTPEVQLEKQIHFAAHQRALAGQPANPILYHPQLAHNTPAHNNYHYQQPQAYHGPQHIPTIVNGVPDETPEVKHAKAFHLAKLQEAQAKSVSSGHYDDGQYREQYNHAPAVSHYQGPYHVPTIINGVPDETPEVKHARAFHLAKLQEAQAKAGHNGHYYH
jgi:hypothetical protein